MKISREYKLFKISLAYKGTLFSVKVFFLSCLAFFNLIYTEATTYMYQNDRANVVITSSYMYVQLISSQ